MSQTAVQWHALEPAAMATDAGKRHTICAVCQTAQTAKIFARLSCTIGAAILVARFIRPLAGTAPKPQASGGTLEALPAV